MQHFTIHHFPLLTSLLLSAVLVHTLVAAAATEDMTTTTTQSTMEPSGNGGGEGTAPPQSMMTSPPTDQSMSCNDEQMKKEHDCCQPAEKVAPAFAEGIVRKAIDMHNLKDNQTTWALETISKVDKKDCNPPLYNVQAKLTRTPAGENNGTSTDCMMKLLYPASEFQASSDRGKSLSSSSSSSTDENGGLVILTFCNSGALWQAGLFVSLLIPLLTAILGPIQR